MPDREWSLELRAAIYAVDAAAVIAKEAFSAGSTGVEDKGDSTPVSDADFEAERRMKKLLGERFPRDTVIGEETDVGGDIPPGRVWLLDAIDGTSNAITGVNPLFMSQACFLVDGEPVVAALKSPVTGQLFTAMSQRGSFLGVAGRTVQLEVSRQTDLSRARVLVGMGSARRDGDWLAGVYAELLALGNPSSPRHFGSSSFELCLVAAGGLSQRGVDAKIDYGSQSWDLAAGALLVREANGVVVDSGGNRWSIGAKSLIAGNAKIACSLTETLAAAVG